MVDIDMAGPPCMLRVTALLGKANDAPLWAFAPGEVVLASALAASVTRLNHAGEYEARWTLRLTFARASAAAARGDLGGLLSNPPLEWRAPARQAVVPVAFDDALVYLPIRYGEFVTAAGEARGV